MIKKPNETFVKLDILPFTVPGNTYYLISASVTIIVNDTKEITTMDTAKISIL